jgi:hypothetical protein
MSSSPFYKLKHLVGETISHIYVFVGDTKKKYKKEDIFSPGELQEIKEQKTEVSFLEELIHKDDTIDIIKQKILMHTPIASSYSEIFLFARDKQPINSIHLYQTLTQNDKLELTKKRITYYFLNIINHYPELINQLKKINKDKDDKIYTYEDINSFGLDDHGEILMYKPIGQKFISIQQSYPYTVNPYMVSSYDPFLEKYADEITSTTNKNILMVESNIYNNEIYICDAENVLNNAIKKNISEESTLKIYFPYLYEKKIKTLDQFIEKREELKIETEQILDDDALNKTIDNINLFYNVYNERENKKDMPFIESGIKEIEFIIHPEYTFFLPLDIIFKSLLHASKKVPFIKYNLGKGREKIIRLYSDKKTVDGIKIPYLNKADIFKLIKNIGNHEGIFVYIEIFIEEQKYTFICEFANNGGIIIKSVFTNAISIEKLNYIMNTSVNDTINVVKDYISQNGYNINNFKDIYQPNIEIVNINYVMNIPIDISLQLEKISGCISSIFNVIEYNINKGIIMRFKRVANYNDMNSQDAFIVDKINLNYNEKDIIQDFSNNFNVSLDDATIKYAEFITSTQTMQNAFNSKKIEIKNNPGFSTTITKEQSTNIHLITVNGINNINYLTTIPIYIDSLIRIIKSPLKTTIPIDLINKLCVKQGKKKQADAKEYDKTVIPEIIATAELPFSDNKQMNIVNEELVYSTGVADDDAIELDDGDDTLLSMMLGFGNDSDDDDAGDADDADDVDDAGEQYSSISIGGSDKKEKMNLGDDNDNDGEKQDKIKGIYFNKSKQKWCAQFLYNKKLIFVGCYNTQKEAGDAYKKKITSMVSVDDAVAETDLELDVDADDADNEGELAIKENIVGQSLNNPNPILKRLKKYEPSLYLTENEGKFNAYSRGCVWSPNVRRQPILLTNKEKEYIDKNHPQSYENAIQYGTNPNKIYWYICPRYWNLKDNISLTEAEVKSGKYGNVIPLGNKTIPPGGTIIDYGEGVDNKNFKKQYPGFIDPSKHPNNKCVPCCYSSWDSPKQISLRNKCSLSPSSMNITSSTTDDDSLNAIKDEYIMNSEKFPLESTKYGYLPLSLQIFLGIDNKKCQVDELNTNLKPDYPCILRHGVENSKNQSFIASIGNIYGRHFNKNKPLSIDETKQKLIKALTLDIFMNLQNGSLIDLFYNSSNQNETVSDKEDMDNIKNEYKKSFLYKNIYKKNAIVVDSKKKQLFNKIVASYENFKLFLNPANKDEEIDYTYLWDLICKPNKELFPNGVNMVILDLVDDDVNNKIQIICPTNHYSDVLFNEALETIMIIKKKNYYEPLFRYTLYKTIRAPFNIDDIDLKDSLKLIKNSMNKKCGIFPSISPTLYKFKKNISLQNLIILLEENDYIIKSHVMNYDGKIIGVIAQESTSAAAAAASSISGVIPCYPSGPLLSFNTDYTWMNDTKYLNTYKDTLKFLNKVKKDSNNLILCNPLYKIVQELIPGKRYIIGVVTETNQFIDVKTPYEEEDINDPIKTIESINYFKVDADIVYSKDMISEVNNIHTFKLEGKFYNAFRNTVRILINKFQNRNVKKEIQTILKSSSSLLYINKLSTIIELLQKLMKDENAVMFKEYSNKELNELVHIGTCSTLNEKEKCTSNLFCKYQPTNDNSGANCKLVIPLKNLINGSNNIEFYYGKIADEILRYNRIKSFIFQSKAFITFNEINYDVQEDELIINSSLLTQEYFENMIPYKKSQYISGNTRDTAVPNSSQNYSNELSFS